MKIVITIVDLARIMARVWDEDMSDDQRQALDHLADEIERERIPDFRALYEATWSELDAARATEEHEET